MITELSKILTYVLHFNHNTFAMQGMIDSLWRGRGDPNNNSLQLLSTRAEQRCLAFTLSFLLALGPREDQGWLFSFYR